jgi:ferredoxin
LAFCLKRLRHPGSAHMPENKQHPTQTPAQAAHLEAEQHYTARLEPGGGCFDAPAGLPLLQAAERAGAAGASMASSCRNGTCRTCICQLLEGQVVYRIEWPGLSKEEKAEGYILPCVAYPASNLVIQLPF